MKQTWKLGGPLAGVRVVISRGRIAFKTKVQMSANRRLGNLELVGAITIPIGRNVIMPVVFVSKEAESLCWHCCPKLAQLLVFFQPPLLFVVLHPDAS